MPRKKILWTGVCVFSNSNLYGENCVLSHDELIRGIENYERKKITQADRLLCVVASNCLIGNLNINNI